MFQRSRSLATPSQLTLRLAPALALMGLAACGGPTKPLAAAPAPTIDLSSIPEETVAHVGNQAITNHQIYQRIADSRRFNLELQPSEALDQLIDKLLLIDEAKRIGLDEDPKVMAVVEAARREAAVQAFEAEFPKEFSAREAELRGMFHGMYDTATMDAIVLSSEADANASLARLKDGGSLQEEAKRSLDSKGAAAGGDMGAVARRTMDPAVAEVAFTAPLDQFVGPIEIRLGWALIRVRDRSVGSEELFEEKRVGLEKMAQQQLAEQAKRHLLSQLGATLGVVIDDGFLKTTGDSLEATEEQLEHVLATVGERQVRYGDLIVQLRALTRGQNMGHMTGPALKRNMARQIVNRMLLEHEALRRGFGEAPAAVAAATKAERAALYPALAAKLASEAEPITEAATRAYYDDNLARFQRPAQRTVAFIVVGTRESAEALLRRARAGEDFGDLARENSVHDQSAVRGGVIGTITDDDVDTIERAGEVELAKAIASAKEGEATGPVQGRLGWHVVLTTEHTPASTAPFESVQEKIAQELQSERTRERLGQRARELRANAQIRVDEAALRRARERFLASGARQ